MLRTFRGWTKKRAEWEATRGKLCVRPIAWRSHSRETSVGGGEPARSENVASSALSITGSSGKVHPMRGPRKLYRVRRRRLAIFEKSVRILERIFVASSTRFRGLSFFSYDAFRHAFSRILGKQRLNFEAAFNLIKKRDNGRRIRNIQSFHRTLFSHETERSIVPGAKCEYNAIVW